MQPTPNPLQARVTELEARVSALENHVESLFWSYEAKLLDMPTLTTVIRSAAASFYGVTESEVRGSNQFLSVRGGASQYRNKSAHERKVMEAREWVVLLMRQCLQSEYENMRLIYRWCSSKMYWNAGTKLNALYDQVDHPERPLWLHLLSTARKKAETLKVSAGTIDQELQRIG